MGFGRSTMARSLFLSLVWLVLMQTTSGCVYRRGVTIALPESTVLLDVDGIPVVFRQAAGPTIVTIDGAVSIEGRSSSGVFLVPEATSYKRLVVDGIEVVRKKGNSVLLSWGGMSFQVTPASNEVVLVEGQRASPSRSWYDANRELIRELRGESGETKVPDEAPPVEMPGEDSSEALPQAGDEGAAPPDEDSGDEAPESGDGTDGADDASAGPDDAETAPDDAETAPDNAETEPEDPDDSAGGR